MDMRCASTAGCKVILSNAGCKVILSHGGCNFVFSSSRCAAPPRKVAHPLSKAVLRSAGRVRFSVVFVVIILYCDFFSVVCCVVRWL